MNLTIFPFMIQQSFVLNDPTTQFQKNIINIFSSDYQCTTEVKSSIYEHVDHHL